MTSIKVCFTVTDSHLRRRLFLDGTTGYDSESRVFETEVPDNFTGEVLDKYLRGSVLPNIFKDLKQVKNRLFFKPYDKCSINWYPYDPFEKGIYHLTPPEEMQIA
jgi:hypothetical protein